MDHKSKNTTPTNPSKKRKASRPKQKAKTQETSKTLQKECKSNTDKKSKDEEAPLQKVQKVKRTYGRKTPQHLPSSSVPTAPAEDSPSESSCSSPSSSGLTNGGQDSAQPPRRSSCKVEVKTGEPTSTAGGGKDAAANKRRKVGAESKPSDEKVPKEVKPAVSVAAAARNPRNQNEEKCLEEKRPAVKKDPPSYTPGSQEERWNLQIVAKGRVTCPKCKTVGRKTVEGLKKHMTNCKMNPFTCQHCGKQLKSLTGMKYHIMADHNNLPSSEDGIEVDSQSMKEKLRKVLKRMGKLKCSKEGCSGSFTSVMGYLYHTRKCGKQESELEKLVLNCRHCGKAYKSRAGLEYHLKSEHGPVSDHEQCPKTVLKSEDEDGKAPKEPNPERTPSGRVKRMSAQVAVFHLQELASEELLKEWPKRKVQRDLVPDDKKLKYARPGLPAFSQEVLRKWKNEVKLQRKVHCPNQGCDSVYTSVSGLKAHLGLCSRGDFEAGKYRCLICDKEFSSESGVKYHINSIHGQDWFVVSTKASKNFEKLLKAKPKQDPVQGHPARSPSLRFAPGHKGWRGQGPRVGPASGPKAKPGEAKAAASSREKDCYDFSGSDSPSSSDSSSSDSSSDSEADTPEAPRHDKWALKRPVARQDASKRAQSNS